MKNSTILAQIIEDYFNLLKTPLFIFDVESRGLYGEGFSVGGGVYIGGEAQYEFRYLCPISSASGGDEQDLKWIESNIPPFHPSNASPQAVRKIFWNVWEYVKTRYPNVKVFGDCIFPVETSFFAQCVKDDESARKFQAPYPFYDIATALLFAGMDPLKTYDRLPSELPKHDPLADARQSARLLTEALKILAKK